MGVEEEIERGDIEEEEDMKGIGEGKENKIEKLRIIIIEVENGE